MHMFKMFEQGLSVVVQRDHLKVSGHFVETSCVFFHSISTS